MNACDRWTKDGWGAFLLLCVFNYLKEVRKRTPAHDDADHQALKMMTRQRVYWSVQEDSLMMLCSVASHLFNSKVPHTQIHEEVLSKTLFASLLKQSKAWLWPFKPNGDFSTTCFICIIFRQKLIESFKQVKSTLKHRAKRESISDSTFVSWTHTRFQINAGKFSITS